MRNAPEEEYEDQSLGWLDRVKGRLGFGSVDDEDYEEFEEESTLRNKATTVHVHSSRVNRVSVWMTVRSFEDATAAGDGLKDGHQQVVNLEKTDPDMARRVVDFLTGVVYALDGTVSKAGERVFLFSPKNYSIEQGCDDGAHKVNSPFHDN